MKQPTAAERLAEAITALLIRIENYSKEAANSPIRIGLRIANQKYAPYREISEVFFEKFLLPYAV